MPKGQRRIALDVAHLGFTENYRIGAVRGIIQYARQHTEWQLLYNQKTLSLLHSFEDFASLGKIGIDGVIFSYWDDQKLSEISSLGVPMLSISNDHPITPPQFACCITDDREVGRVAARDFLDRGFAEFAFYGDKTLWWERERYEGFREVLLASNDDCSFICCDYSTPPLETARDVAKRLRELKPPLGVLASSDTRGLHLLEVCRHAGLAVPNDVAIIGVDNNPLICEAQLPSLSSVEQDPERVGYEAAALLGRMLEEERQLYDQVVVKPRGVVTRMSSDIAAVDHPKLSRALEFIREHVAEPISVKDIANATMVSRSSLERMFHERLRSTVNGFLRRQRLTLAKDLLLHRDASLQQIAEWSGFRRATYLCNVFQEEFGQTPTEWRQQFNINKPL